VDSILSQAKDPNTKFFALQILDDAVNVKNISNQFIIRQDGKSFQMSKNMELEHSSFSLSLNCQKKSLLVIKESICSLNSMQR
jgi:hypothetical protein